MKPLLRMLLVDDQELIVKALSILLLSEGATLGAEVVGTAGNAKDALIQAQHLKPDLILMDMHMPDINGNEAAENIKRHLPHTKILMLSGFDSLKDVNSAKSAGADGYVYKSDSPQSLITNIIKVMSGEHTFVSKYDVALLDQTGPQSLTRRQGQVLKLLMQGEKNKSIAHTLNISTRTVEKHRTLLMAKLNYPNPTELSNVAHEMGFIDNLPP